MRFGELGLGAQKATLANVAQHAIFQLTRVRDRLRG